ncbi:MAG: SDR family NAD(P)-dependent oxidoreductase [Aggregatilineales bacterium]
MAQKTILITGASRGLGLALASQLAKDGWTLILDARGAEALESVRAELSKQTQVIVLSGDITDPAHRLELEKAVHTAGGLDALINNASTLGPSPRPMLLDYPLDALEAVYRTNVFAPLALLQTLRNELKPGARIINVSSDAGVEPYDGWGGYGPSKAALEHLSAILAAERPDWRVYWVDPGDMRTQMHQEAFPDEDISDRPLPEDSVPGFVALLTGDLPSGRYRAREIKSSTVSPVQGLRVVLTVSDFERAAKFYRDGLGLPVIDQWIEPDSKGILLGAGKATLELFDEAQAAEVDQIEVGKRTAGQIRLAFTVAPVEEVVDTLQQRGAGLVGGPVDTPWGHRNVRLQAPRGIQDGIQLTLSQVISEPEEGS